MGLLFLELDKCQVRRCVVRVIRRLSSKNLFGGLLWKKKNAAEAAFLGMMS